MKAKSRYSTLALILSYTSQDRSFRGQPLEINVSSIDEDFIIRTRQKIFKFKSKKSSFNE